MKKHLLLFFAIAFSQVMISQTPNSLWAQDSYGDEEEFPTCIATDLFGNVYVAGTFNGDSIILGGSTIYNQSSASITTDLFIVKYSASGNVLWTKAIHGAWTEQPNAITTDQEGNFYLTGSVNSYLDTIDFGGLFMNNPGFFIVKFDSNGNPIWLTEGGNGYGRSVSVDVNNNVYVAGAYFDTLKIGSLIIGNNDGSSQDIFVAKIDPFGNPLWLKSAGGTDWADAVDEAWSVTSDLSGNVYVAGKANSAGSILFGSIPTTSGGFVTKYDSLGNEVWVRSKQYGSPIYITIDKSGNVYTAGYFVSSPIIYGTFSLINNGTGSTKDGLIVKYDSLGNVVWAKNVGGNQYDEINSITIDARNNIYVTGYFNSPLFYIIGSPSLTNNSTGPLGDIFVLKCDSLGNFVWSGSYGGADADWGTGIDIDQNGFLNITGHFKSPTLIFGMDTLTNIGAVGTKDMFITKLSSSFVSDVWPGDANHDFSVNNNDLLPLGLFYGQAGVARSGISNVWQAHMSADWNTMQTNLSDIKHIDCNGDGSIDMSDSLAINLNFSSSHSIIMQGNSARAFLPDMYFVSSSSSYFPGDSVDIELWLGTALNPVSGLYGVSFNINFDPFLIESGTESLTYPNSWLGNPGTNAIKFAKIDPATNTIFGAETRIDQINANGFGKIADFKFKVNNSITVPTQFYFTISGYQSNDSIGNNLFFNTVSDSILIQISNTGVTNLSGINKLNVSPNPSSGIFVFSNMEKESTIEIYDITGRVVMKTISDNAVCNINLEGKAKGIYFYRVKEQNKIIQQGKIILH